MHGVIRRPVVILGAERKAEDAIIVTIETNYTRTKALLVYTVYNEFNGYHSVLRGEISLAVSQTDLCRSLFAVGERLTGPLVDNGTV